MEELNQVASRFVTSRFGDRAQNIKTLAFGDWSRAYSFLLDEDKMVIRFGTYRDDYEKDRVMSRYSSDKLPIPKVLEVGETENGFYALSEWVPGRPLDGLNGSEIRLVLPQFFEALNELQKLDHTDAQVVGLWRPDGAGPRWGDELLSVTEPRVRLAGWRERLEASPKEAQIFDAGVERLRQLSPQLPEYRGIVHNDPLNRNVLVDAGKLTGIIDWGNAFYGDPLYDIAWFIYCWPWYPEWQGIDLQEMIDNHWDKHGGPPKQMEERLLSCLIHLSLDHISYSAFKQRPEEMVRHAERLLTYI